jgi:endo-1,4-beta-xylanase
VSASAGAPSGGAPTGAAGMSGGAPGGAGISGGGTSGSPGTSATNLVTNGTFDTTSTSPWWGYANDTIDPPAAQTLAVTDGRLCSTMTAGGEHPWDVIIGVSGLALLPNQYYHIAFSVSADADRTIKFKTGFGDVPYTDYFLESVAATTTPQVVEYTYLNLRNDPNAQFQFQIGGSVGTVCLDNIVLEPVPAPATPAYTTPATSGHPFKYYKDIVKMGTAVDTPMFLSSPLHNSIVAGEFSMITPANSMKMNLIEPTQGVFDYTDTDALAAWAKANGLEFRGHPLVWHTQTPSWLTDGTWDATSLTAVMYAHIDGVLGHYVGQFPYWDVVNEAIDQVNGTWTFRSTIWHDTIGDNFMDLAFQHAHMVDPNAKLFYNDYNIEQKGNAKADKVFEVVSDMKTRGIPIDGVGFQGHYYVQPDGSTSGGVPNMKAIADNMARYAAINVEVHITECDFRIGKPLDDSKTQIQTKFYADLLQVCIDAPNCSHFTLWGLSDADSWVPGTFPDYDYAHVWDKQLMPKPAYEAMSQKFATASMATGMAGAPGAAGTSGSAGGSGGAVGSGGTGAVSNAGAPGVAGSGASSSGHPSAAKKDSGGCSLASSSTDTAPWLVSVLSLLGIAVVRRRSQRARA